MVRLFRRLPAIQKAREKAEYFEKAKSSDEADNRAQEW